MTLRPQTLDAFIGQSHLKKLIQTSIVASKLRREALDHTLLTGPSGTGKTTLAFIIANELGKKAHVLNAAGVENFDSVRKILTSMGEGDILFIDEIHRLPIKIEEFLYHPMEDSVVEVEKKISVMPEPMRIKLNIQLLTSPPERHASIEHSFRKYAQIKKLTVLQKIPPITIIGATTKVGDLTKPLRDRFNLSLDFTQYNENELDEIARQKADMLDIGITPDASRSIARRSRGTARIVVNYIRRCRDTADVWNDSIITLANVESTLSMLGVDPIGLTKSDLAYLHVLMRDGRPKGIRSLSSSLNEEIATIEDVIEPYLIQIGFIEKTPQGRIITGKGEKYVKGEEKVTL